MVDAIALREVSYLQPMHDAAIQAGAKGVSLAGNGPAVIAFTDGRKGAHKNDTYCILSLKF